MVEEERRNEYNGRMKRDSFLSFSSPHDKSPDRGKRGKGKREMKARVSLSFVPCLSFSLFHFPFSPGQS